MRGKYRGGFKLELEAREVEVLCLASYRSPDVLRRQQIFATCHGGTCRPSTSPQRLRFGPSPLPFPLSPANPLSLQQSTLLPRGAEGADQMSNALNISKTPAVIVLILYLVSTLVLWSREFSLPPPLNKRRIAAHLPYCTQTSSATVGKATCSA